jgi:hypothetical protein
MTDIFSYLTQPNVAIVITTNLCQDKNGFAVMGAGLAAAAKARFPALPRIYGEALPTLRNSESFPFFVYERLILIPTKPWRIAYGNFSWRQPSSYDLVETGIYVIGLIQASRQDLKIVLPNMGCKNGGLELGKVAPWLRWAESVGCALCESVPAAAPIHPAFHPGCWRV